MSTIRTLLFIGSVIASTTTATNNATPTTNATSPNVNHTIQTIVDEIERWKHEYEEKVIKEPNGVRRPFVTLTFAQSLDGRIAIRKTLAYGNENDDSDASISSNLQLSGDESWRMSHALRSIHDAVLIGGQTFSIDNPRLTNRLWPPFLHQPRPVILDTHLNHFHKIFGETPLSERDIIAKCRCHRPIFCCSLEAASKFCQKLRRYKLLSSVEFLPCNLDEKGNINLQELVRLLRENFAIQSLMVEGGAAVLTSFASSRHLVDCLCVTITPKLLGDARGLPPFYAIDDATTERDAGSDNK